MSRRIATAVVVLLLVGVARSTGADAEVYRRPLGTVIDSFRKPATAYSAGNRGWEIAVANQSPVTPIGDGVVTFAGQVGGVLDVVVRHPDGLLTTYAKLMSIAVQKGERVSITTTLGTSGPVTYLGARRNGHYVDPRTLFASDVYLVPTTADPTRTH